MATLDERVRQQLETWRRDLINLTRNNRLLYLKTNLGLQIESPEPQELFDRLGKGFEVYLPPLDGDPNPPKPPRSDVVRFTAPERAKLVAKLRSLDRNATQSFMDRGVWVLYLAFGQLEWEEAKGSDGTRQLVRSPLLLVPVQLKRASASEPYRLSRAEEEQKFNPALLAKLEADFEIALRVPDDEDELEPATLLKSIAAQVQSRGWNVIPIVLLSTFSFQKEPILKDLLDNEEAVMASALVRGLALGKDAEEGFEFEPVSEAEVDELAPPERTITIRPADATQRRAIASAVGGKSFVMDGPPGTGKSQTIANMIADLLAKKKKVLFVSDKIAALEVVHNRLKEAGLHEFVLEIHSHKTTRKEVAKALGRAIQTRVSGKSSMSETDRERLRRLRGQLSDYVEGVNTPRAPLNQTLHNVIGRIARAQHLPQAPQPDLTFEQIDNGLMSTIIDAAEAIARTWGPIARGDSFMWQELADGVWSQGRRLEILGLLDGALDSLARLEETASAVAEELALYPPASLAEVHSLGAVEAHLIARPRVETDWLTAPDLSSLLARLRAAREEARAIEQAEAALSSSVGPQWSRLEAARATRLRDDLAELEGLAPGDSALRTKTGRQLRVEVKALRELAQYLDELVSHGALLATSFDVAPGELTAQRTNDLVALVGLASGRDLPEANWFLPAGLTSANTAMEQLRPLAEQLKAESVSDTFSPAVLDLDLESLCLRFEEIYRGWFIWLNGDYRRDRNLLKRVARSGRLRREELERLRDALGLQQAVKAFDAAEAEYAAALESYWAGAATDFDRAQSALDVVKCAQTLGAGWVPTPALQRNLSRGTEINLRVSDAATLAKAASEKIAAQGSLAEVFLARALDTASSGALRLSKAIERVLENVLHTEEVCGRALSVAEAMQYLQSRKAAADLRDGFAAARVSDARLFGAEWSLSGAPWDNLAAAIEWTDGLRNLLGGPIETGVATTLASAVVSRARIPEPYSEFGLARDAVAGLFNAAGASSLQPQLARRLGAVRDVLAQLRDSVDDVAEWYAYAQTRSILSQNGMDDPLRFCCKQRVRAEQVRPILERAVLEKWVDHVLESDPRLRDVRSRDRDALVAAFTKLDRRLIQLAAFDAISVCNDMRPTNIMGQAGVILREAEKQRRHMPVRRLLDEAKDVVQSIKPCLMMSPLSVSQFLPSSMRFDVIIFDEASQVKPADAISSIYRGTQLVVAGDQRQLPPTAFFDRMDGGDDDAYDEEEPESFESVLDLCKGSGLFTSVPLRWHYRSQHEHLITYSNYCFYDGNLLTFPGATQEADDLGIEVFRVDGVYRRGGQRDNPIEAQKVGERVLFHAQRHPTLTIGVVAFSEAQASTIDAVLDKLADAHPELRRIREQGRLDGLFVKNLETVQGDERDIIIFSMGYGKDENGKFTMNFGPLTKPGGERRLNVAITRARKRVDFVTSVGVADFTSELASEGGRHLRRYLDFASRREDRMSVLAIPVIQGGGDFESPFEAEVARVVRSWGHDVLPQVGCAGYRVDLSVRDPLNPMRFVLGIECDGAMYHSSKVARDRDRLRQEVLEGLGWRLHRIWGPAWYRNRKEQEDRLKQAIDDAISAKRTGSASFPPPAAPNAVPIQVVEINLEETPEWVTTYQTASVYPVNASTRIETETGKREIQRIAHAIVQVEGPVHEARILAAVREAFGVGRAGARIQASFDSALSSARAKDRTLHLKGGFMWIEGAELSVRVPDPEDPETERSVDEVAPQELELALRLAVRDAKSIEEYALMTYVARLFGWDRSGSQITAALGGCIRRLVKRQVLVTDSGVLRLGEQSTS